MPIYEYQCKFCARPHDALQKISDEPLVTCPHCGKAGLTKIISKTAGFDLKGTGWYMHGFKDKAAAAPSTETKSAPAAQ